MTPDDRVPWSARLVPLEYRDAVLGDALELAQGKAARSRRWRTLLWLHAFLLTAALAAWRQKIFGGRRRRVQAARRQRMYGAIASDFTYAARSLARAPGFFSVSVLTLALGIGGVIAMYSLLYASLIRPLAYDRAQQLIVLNTTTPEGEIPAVSHPDLVDIRESSRALTTVATWRPWRVTFAANNEAPTRMWGASVDSRYLAMLGIAPIIGRQFTEEDDVPNHEPVIMISHALWQGTFGGDTALVGRSIELDGERYTVVGVLPAGFVDPLAASFSLTTPPIWRASPTDFTNNTNRSWRSFWALGRIVEGTTIEQVDAELNRIGLSLEEDWPSTNTTVRFRAMPLREHLIGANRATIILLAAAVMLVLVVACANVANLLLTRGTSRADEHAVRSALGAGRIRVVRPLVMEHGLIVVVGLIAGLGTAWSITRLSSGWTRELDTLVSIRLDLPVIIGAGIVSFVIAMIFGVVPAWQAVGSDSNVARGHRTLDRRGARLRKGLVVIETALAVALLLSAGLLFKSFRALGRVDLGVDVTHTLVGTITPSSTRYTTSESLDRVVSDIITRVRAVPGVRSAGVINDLPLSGAQDTGTLARLDRTYQPGEAPSAEYRTVTPDYFRVAGLSVVTGRGFDQRDGSDGSPAIVISESAARRLYPGEDPIGKGVRIMGFNRDIVGVVSDVRDRGPAEQAPMTVYVPFGQEVQEWALRTTTLMVAVQDGAPSDYVVAVRDAVISVDRTTAINDMRTMQDVAAAVTRAERFRTTVMTAFAIVTVVLAAVGLAGVVAFQVAHRGRELGLRMALGATGRGVVSMVVRQGVRLSALGALVGIGCATILGRWFGHLLYAVTPLDPVVFVTVPILFLCIAATAALIPAVRAARLDPAVALRAD